jgi:phage terminase small subunit
MSEERQRGTKPQLAIALAQGSSVTKWAQDNDVPRPTAYRWAKEPEVRKTIQACRRRMLDRAVGMMVKRVPWTVPKLFELAAGAESESVRLQAIKTIYKEMITVSKYSGLEERMTEIEGKLDARDRIASGAG